ncbi:MAG: hypothetical protein HY912_10625, partial [Desulfomonile tiedjei]|nr:hypothetical protein [Desulfomonile tiedjei]
VGLEKFYNMLLDRGIITQMELQEHHMLEGLREKELSAEVSSFICPCCLASHAEMFDICPSCGVSFQELISRETLVNSQTPRNNATAINDGSKCVMAQEHKEETGVRPGEPPVSVPPAIIEPDVPSKPLNAEPEENYFMSADDLPKGAAGFDDALDEIGEALDSVDEDTVEEQDGILCDSCDSPMQAGLRDIYDQTRGKQSFVLAAICFALGFLGTLALGLFDGFSFARLIAVYATGLLLLFGTVFSGVGAFMFMAREKVFFCPSCTRIYPRG